MLCKFPQLLDNHPKTSFARLQDARLQDNCTKLGNHYNPASLAELYFSVKMFVIQIFIVSLHYAMIKSV